MTAAEGGLENFYREHVAQEASDFRFVALKELLSSRLEGRSVADIGCGTGTMVRELSRSGLESAGFEPAAEIFKLAREAKERSGLGYPLFNAGLDTMTPEHLAPFKNILFIDVLEHLKDDHAALKRIYSLMPEGAKLLCLVPAVASLYGRRDKAVGHFRRYDKKDIEAIFALCPFRSVTIRHWNLLGVPPFWFFEKVLGRPIAEGFRMRRPTALTRALNGCLLGWFRLIENRISFPVGLSLLVEAVK